MNQSFQRLEKIAREHSMTPRFLREIVYYGALGYKYNQIVEKVDCSETTVTNYRNKIREMEEDEAAEIFQLVAEVKSS